MRLTTINEWLPTRRKWGIYLLWPGGWSASTQWPRWARKSGVTMTRIYLTRPGGGWWWTPIVRVTKAPKWERRL